MWEVYYSDGTIITSDEVDPYSLEPRDGVQVIIQSDSEHRWVVVPPNDYYMWDTRGGVPQWYAGDREGLSSYLRKAGHKAVLIGEWIDKYAYRNLLSIATERLGEKAGYDANERKP